MLAVEPGGVLNKCAQFGGRDPGHCPHLAVEMRLVGISAGRRRAEGARRRAEDPYGLLETRYARDRLRGQPDLPAEARLQSASTDAELCGQPADRAPASRLL